MKDPQTSKACIKVLLLTIYYLPGYKGGGPIKTTANLIDTTSAYIDYFVVTSDRDLGDRHPYSDLNIGEWNNLKHSTVFYAQSGLKGIRQIYEVMHSKEYDCVYLNSFFSIRFSLIPLLLAKAFGKPVILGPRGEFSEGALRLKQFKKILYIKLYKILRLNRGVLFQASSNFELADIQKVLGVKNTCYIAEDIGSQEFTKGFKYKRNDVIKLVFLSRISPMKNLAYAIDILGNVNCSVSYDIYGPIEDPEYWHLCEQKIKKLPENITVNYMGTLNPNNVVEKLSTYDLFFMPTKGENYSHVITEALCAGLPILIADTTPWRNLESHGIGWDIPLNQPRKFSTAIEQASAMTGIEFQEYRKKVLSWAKHKFAQPEAINENKKMFKFATEKK